MQLNRSTLVALAVVGVVLAVAAGWLLFNRALDPSSEYEDYCTLRADPRDAAPDNWTVANITEGFLQEWPLLQAAIDNGFVRTTLEAAHEVIYAIEDLGATTRGSGDPGLRTYIIYQDQVYYITGSCAVQ